MISIKSIAARAFDQFQQQLPQGSAPGQQIQFIYLLALHRMLGLPRSPAPEWAHDWLQQIRENQQADGYFLQNTPATDFSQLAFSALSVAALQLADLDIRFPLYFIRGFADQTFTENWFLQPQNILITPECSIRQAVNTGKTFLYTASLLGKTVADGILTDTALKFFLDCNDARVNPATGFWVQNESHLSAQGLVDGWARAQAYFYFNRSLPYPQKMLHSLLHLQRRTGHFHTCAENFLLTDLAALTFIAALSRQMRGIQLRTQWAIKRVNAAVNRLVPVTHDTLPPFPSPWVAESTELGFGLENNLQQVVLFYYWVAVQQLTEALREKHTINTITSPCFTFQPQISVEKDD